MCGRFTLRKPMTVVAELFDLVAQASDSRETQLRFNIAPTQEVAAVRTANSSAVRELAWLRWGLVPSWADDPSIGSRMINARGESVDTKPAFRDAFRHRRCLIPADGFYEWQRGEHAKQPYYIRLKFDQPFAFAGLWDCWHKGGKTVESCTIITTAANDVLRPLHDRMPVILDRDDYSAWLDPAIEDAQAVKPLLRPYRSEALMVYLVSTRVNSPRNNGPECVERATPGKTQQSLFG